MLDEPTGWELPPKGFEVKDNGLHNRSELIFGKTSITHPMLELSENTLIRRPDRAIPAIKRSEAIQSLAKPQARIVVTLVQSVLFFC